MSKRELEGRVQGILREFGLQAQSNTIIGTPFKKGLSGGQKRRVSVASQLITGPSILFLDEPTSGLDSTASYEIMSYIRDIAKQHNVSSLQKNHVKISLRLTIINQLIVIASIHQPSTKTFDLFDQVTLLSQGRVCFCGPRVSMPNYFSELDLEIPPLMNPAEHLLDLVNIDFTSRRHSSHPHNSHSRLARITTAWSRSPLSQRLSTSIAEISHRPARHGMHLLRRTVPKPGYLKQTLVLLHRSWIKSYRDIVTYWVRVIMYLGLAIMMGTVWLRLSTEQKYIQAFVNAIVSELSFFSFSFFLSLLLF
jgi:ABC-type multidrug transport system ATPase subunit